MSGLDLYAYKQSETLIGVQFYALIAAAMRTADTTNLNKLQEAFPEVYSELQQRHNASGGRINGE